MNYWRPLYYGLAGFWLLAGLASGERIFFVLLFSQALLALAALGLNFWAAYTFSFQQDLETEQTIRGEPVQLALKIHNEQFIPYPLMKIRISTPAISERRELRFNLPAQSHLDFNLHLDCPYRGDYEVGMTVIDFIDIFNLVRLPFDMRLLPYYRMKRLLVYPTLDKPDNLPLPVFDRKAFSRRTFATENPDEPFSTIRDYRRGDSRKQIHWQASLRQQSLMTRQYELSEEPHILLLLDLSQTPGFPEAALQAQDACCTGAAAVIHYLLRQNVHLRIVSCSEAGVLQVESGSGMKDFQRFYRWLAGLKFSGKRPLPALLHKALPQSENTRAVLVLTTQSHPVDLPDQIATLLQHHRSGRPIVTLLASPAGPAPESSDLMIQLHQANLPAWSISYGGHLTGTKP